MASDSPPRLSRRHAWVLALTATATMAVSYVDRQTLAVLSPTITKELGISDAWFGWVISSFSLAYLVGAPLAGRLIDKVGARRGLLGAVLVWSGIAALHALMPSLGVLFALRIALGLAEAPSFPGAAQTIHRALPPADRARGFGVLFTGSSIGSTIAPPLADYLAARFGWRSACIGTAVVGLSWVPLWYAVAWNRASRAALEASPDAVLDAPESDRHPGDYRLAPQRANDAAPTMWQLAASPAVLRTFAVVLASAPVIGLVLNWGAKYLVRDHHLKQGSFGWYLAIPPVLFDGGAILFGHLASRARARGERGAPWGLLLSAAILAVTGALVPLAGGPLPSIVVAGVCLAGGGGLYALCTVDMLARVPPGSVATAGGLAAAAQSLALIVANPIIGRVVEDAGSYTPVFVGLSLWVVPGCALWLAWKAPPVYREVEAAG